MTAPFDLEDAVWDVPPAPPPPRRARLLVVVGIAVGLFAVLGIAAVVIDQAIRVAVPDLVGMTLADASETLEDGGLVAATPTADGVCAAASHIALCIVTAQADAAGDRLHAGSEVALTVVPTDVTVPHVAGSTLAAATAILQAAGFVVDLADRDVLAIDGSSAWRVLAQSARHGTTEPAGTTIVLTVRWPTAAIPEVVGSTLADAATSLDAAGFTVDYALPDGFAEPLDAWIVVGMDPVPVAGELPIGVDVTLEWSVRVPVVTGVTGDHALDLLAEVGLDADFVAGSSSRTAVVTQVPAAGALAGPGAVVMLTTSASSVVFEVVSDGKSAAITWTDPVTLAQHKATGVKLPWKKEYAPETTPDIYALGNITAQVEGEASIACRIILNGVVVVEQTAKGAKASVSCN